MTCFTSIWRRSNSSHFISRNSKSTHRGKFLSSIQIKILQPIRLLNPVISLAAKAVKQWIWIKIKFTQTFSMIHPWINFIEISKPGYHFFDKPGNYLHSRYMAFQKEESELGQQLLEYLYQYPNRWLKDYELYDSFKSYSRKTIHNHLSLLSQEKFVERTRYQKLKRPTKNHFQYYSYKIDQKGKIVIGHIRKESKNYSFSVVALMLAALALLVAFKM